MSDSSEHTQGHVRPAPESFIKPDLVASISAHGIDDERRGLLKGAFASALVAMTGKAVAGESDPNIVNVPEWSKI